MNKWLAAIAVALTALLIGLGFAYKSQAVLMKKIQDESDTKSALISNFEKTRKADQQKVRAAAANVSKSRQREANLRLELEHAESRDFLDMVIPDRMRESLCNHFGTCTDRRAD